MAVPTSTPSPSLQCRMPPPIIRPATPSTLPFGLHCHRRLLHRLARLHHLLPLLEHSEEAGVGLDACLTELYEGVGLVVGLAVLTDGVGDDDGGGAGDALGGWIHELVVSDLSKLERI
jgi:hypothetical protein